MNIQMDGDVRLDEATLAQAQTFFDGLAAVNLDEVTTEVLRVGIRDYREETMENGQKRRIPWPRIAEIENFVPMKVFNRMMASRNRVLKERQIYLSQGDRDDHEDPMIGWMMSQVLAVWQLSEPDMTLERLERGLDFERVSALFTRFFARLLQQTRK